MCDLGVGDVGEDNGEPGLRIDIVELGGLDEGIGDRRGLAAAGRADEEIVLSSDRQGSDGALRGGLSDENGSVSKDRDRT